MKKICATFLAFILLFSVSSSAFAATSPLELPSCYDDFILQQALAMDSQAEILQDKDFEVIAIGNVNELTAYSNDTTGRNSTTVFQAKELNGNSVEVITIIPYKVQNDGSLMNSFDYAVTPYANSDDVTTTTFTDVSITVTAYYDVYGSAVNLKTFYRHDSVQAYWNSSNASVSVSNMRVWYDSRGETYRYPDCISEPPLTLQSTILNDDYFIRSEINVNAPVKTFTYSDSSHSMPSNLVMRCTEFMIDGGLISIQLSYMANGNSRVDSRSYYVYTA